VEEPRQATLLRLPPALKAAMRELAREHKRSLTREVEVALENHIAPVPRPTMQAEHSI
jgi:hypothetical protein